jgi:Fic family protein
MEVVSGAIGNERVHFTAPPAAQLEREMTAFLDWFNKPADIDEVLQAGLSHLWFVTIHPFEDGNGRIARAIADMALARSEKSPQRFYSMSTQIRQERAAYYDILERTQKGTMDVTQWMDWFLGCLGRAIDGAQQTLGAVLAKARFWERVRGVPLNERQTLILNRLLDGFEGKLTTSKYAKLTKSSQDTAWRDILPLLEKGILVRGPEGGRSTSYSLAAAYRGEDEVAHDITPADAADSQGNHSSE